MRFTFSLTKMKILGLYLERRKHHEQVDGDQGQHCA